MATRPNAFATSAFSMSFDSNNSGLQKKKTYYIFGTAIVGCCISIMSQITSFVLLGTRDQFVYPEALIIGSAIFRRLPPRLAETFSANDIKEEDIFIPYIQWLFDFTFAISLFQCIFTVAGIIGLHRARLRKRRNALLDLYCAAQGFCVLAFLLLLATRLVAQERFAPAIIYHLALLKPIITELEQSLICCGAYGFIDYVENPDLYWLWGIQDGRPDYAPSVPTACCRQLRGSTKTQPCERNPTSANTYPPCGTKVVALLNAFDQSLLARRLNMIPVGFSLAAAFACISAGVLISLNRRKTKNK